MTVKEFYKRIVPIEKTVFLLIMRMIRFLYLKIIVTKFQK